VSCFFLTHSVVPTDELGTYDDGDDDVLQASGDDRCRMQLTVVRSADTRRPTMTGIRHSRLDGEIETESDVTGCLQTRRPARQPRRGTGRQPVVL